jgi:hypothetical protein
MQYSKSKHILKNQQETRPVTAMSKYSAIQVASLKPSDIRKFFDNSARINKYLFLKYGLA